jgi:hypothetical protein
VRSLKERWQAVRRKVRYPKAVVRAWSSTVLEAQMQAGHGIPYRSRSAAGSSYQPNDPSGGHPHEHGNPTEHGPSGPVR